MTPELQRAMAQYEEARIEDKKAVLASLNGASDGDAIRRAIRKFQAASAWLKRYQAAGAPAPAPAPHDEPVWSFVAKLLKAS